MISNCGHDENNKYHGGKAGDQTSTEYRVINWYNRPWDHVLRAPTREIGNKLAEISREAANNDNVGYDQYERKTYYFALKVANWHPEDIKKKCETDCSASSIANVIATGHQLGIKALENLSPDVYSGNIRKALVAVGFKDLTDSKYLTSDAYLLPGDILLYENHHVAINLSTGSKASETTKKAYTGTFPTLPKRGYFKKGDGYNTLTSYKTQIRRVQRFLNWALSGSLVVDGEYGEKTAAACTKFQKTVKITADGLFGKDTLAKAKAYRK